MTLGMTRFFAAEFYGGPWDGKRRVLRFPPLPVFEVAVLFPLRDTFTSPTEVPPDFLLRPQHHHYRLLETADGADVVALSDEAMRHAAFDLREVATRHLAALTYRYQGVR